MQHNYVSPMPTPCSGSTFSMVHITISELVEDTSTREIKSTLNFFHQMN